MRPLVLAVDMEIAGQHAVDVVVLEIERLAKIRERPFADADARVDLLAAVGARIAQRELPGHVHARQVLADHRAADVGVGVFDDEVAVDVAPVHVPGAHFRSGKAALDARAAERAEHHAVELADAVDRNRLASARQTRS